MNLHAWAREHVRRVERRRRTKLERALARSVAVCAWVPFVDMGDDVSFDARIGLDSELVGDLPTDALVRLMFRRVTAIREALP